MKLYMLLLLVYTKVGHSAFCSGRPCGHHACQQNNHPLSTAAPLFVRDVRNVTGGNATLYSVGIASVNEIFRLNILQASLLSMKRAIDKLPIYPNLVLIDGIFAPKGIENFKTIINGDEKIKCISAASIIAKTYRDLLMIKLSEKFKHYAWERNFGYGTKAHMDGLKKFGITSHHRKGFKPVHKMLSK